jgi:peptide/nickel transport system substrate-binding protein
MLQYIRASRLTTLASMAALFALAFLIFGCGDDEPEPTAQAMPAPATVDVAAITAGISAGLTAQMEQTIRDEMAKAQPPLSEDEIRTLIESAYVQIDTGDSLSAEVKAMIDGAVAAAVAEGVNQEDVTEAIAKALIEAAEGQAEPLSESDVARIVQSAMSTPAPTPAPTAQPTPAPTEAPVMAMMPVESRLKVAMPNPAYGERMEASVHNVVGGFLIPNAESLVGDHHITGEYYPMLATEWSVGEDARSWTFKLREGVPWHGIGTNFSAQDVIHSFNRTHAKVSVHSYRSRWPLPDGTAGQVVGSITAVGDNEVRFDMVGPYTRLHKAIAGSEGLFMSSKSYFDLVGEDGYRDNPVGTGPYQFSEIRSSEYSLWEAVDYDHYRVNPQFPELQLVFSDEEATRIAMMVSQETHTTVVSKTLTKQAEGIPHLKVVTTTLPTLHLNIFFGGNYPMDFLTATGEPAVDENLPWYGHSEDAVKVRRALSMAIDRDAINNAFYDGDGEKVLVSLFHPGLGPWKPEWEARFNELHAYNPDMARQLLAEAGYPDGITGYKWSLYFIDIAPEGLDIAEAVVAMWKEIGVELEIETTERSTWGGAGRAKETAGFVYIWHSTYAPIEARFEIYSWSGRPGAGFTSEKFDELYLDLQNTNSVEAMNQKLLNLGDVIQETIPYVPLFWVFTDYIVNTRVIADYTSAGIWQVHDWEYAVPVKN